MSYSILCHDIPENNIPKACKIGIMLMITIYMFIRYALILWYRKDIRSIIQHVSEDYKANNFQNLEEKSIIHEYTKKGTSLGKQWVILVGSASIAFVCKAMVIMLYRYLFGDFELEMILDVTIPFEEIKMELYVFIPLNILLIICSVYVTSVLVGYESFVPSLMLHACGQLEVINFNIAKLFPDTFNVHQCKAQMKEIIIKLQKIYRFVVLIC